MHKTSKPKNFEEMVYLMRQLKDLSKFSKKSGCDIAGLLIDAAYEDISENITININDLPKVESEKSEPTAIVY